MVKKKIISNTKKKLKKKLHLKKIIDEQRKNIYEKIDNNRNDEIGECDAIKYDNHEIHDNDDNEEIKDEMNKFEISHMRLLGLGPIIVGAVNGTSEQERREDLLKKHRLVSSISSSGLAGSSGSTGKNMACYVLSYSFLLFLF